MTIHMNNAATPKKNIFEEEEEKNTIFLLSIEILLCKIVIRHNQSLALELINLKQGLIHLLLVFVISIFTTQFGIELYK